MDAHSERFFFGRDLGSFLARGEEATAGLQSVECQVPDVDPRIFDGTVWGVREDLGGQAAIIKFTTRISVPRVENCGLTPKACFCL